MPIPTIWKRILKKSQISHAPRHPSDEIEYFDGIIEDITARKTAREALAESEPGKGTMFSVFLPSLEKEFFAEDERDDIITGTGKILLMDDEPELLRTAVRILEGIGYEVVTAETGEEAVNRCRQPRETEESFAAVILDLTIKGGMGEKKHWRN